MLPCRFLRTLYCVKHAPRSWFSKFSYTIGSFGFLQVFTSPPLYLEDLKLSCVYFVLMT